MYFVIFCLIFIKIQANENVLIKDLKVPLQYGDIPMIGFGCGNMVEAEEIEQALDKALAVGYRLIDTAAAFGNEEIIGKALKKLLPKHNLTRKDIFITTKLSANVYSYGKHAYEALKDSVRKLDSNYVDLYLIHFPGIFPPPEPNMNFSKLRDESWKQLIKGQKDGLAKNLGVSNYHIRHLTELLNNNHDVKPVLNQIEWNPEYHQDDLRDFCQKEGILVQAYYALGGEVNKTKLLDKDEVQKIALKLNKTPAQVILRWSVQQNILAVPKSRGKKHLKENLDLNFEIPMSDMKILSTIKQTGKSIWNPERII